MLRVHHVTADRLPALPRSHAWQQMLQRRGGLALTLGLLLYAVVWLSHLAYASLSPPADNIEQLTWVRSLELGYYKHPPLPTWLFWLPTQLFGVNALTSYATGAALTLGSMGLLWRLLASLHGRRHATLALLAVLCVTYYNGRLYYYNHNIVLMLCVTLSAVSCWKAWSTGQLRWWAVLGLSLGFGALTKYQIGVTAVSVLVFWCHQRGWREVHHRRGLLLAALIALAMFVPHVQWLRANDFGPIHYAMESSLGVHFDTATRWEDAVHWVVDQLLNRALPAWLLLGAAVWGLRRRGVPVPMPARSPRADAGRALLLSWGLVPLAFMPLTGVTTGADLQLQWGTPFLLFAVPAAMELLGGRVDWARVSMRPVVNVFIGLQALLLTLSHLTSPRGPGFLHDHHWRSFDGDALARIVEEPAQRALAGRGICIVSGPGAPAGALALRLTDRPLVLIDGRFDRSPWIDAERVRDCGVLELHEGAPRDGGQAVGPTFPRLSWRVLPPVVLMLADAD